MKTLQFCLFLLSSLIFLFLFSSFLSRLDKMSLVSSRQLNTEEDGYVVDMNYFDTGETPL